MDIQLAIVAHDPGLRKQLADLVAKHRLMIHAIHLASNLNDALIMVREHPPLAMLLEVELGRHDGLEVLRAMSPRLPAVALFANSTSCAMEAIRFRPVDLLLKTADHDRIDEAVLNVLDLAQALHRQARLYVPRGVPMSDRQIALKLNNGLAVMHLDDILYLKSNDDLTEVHLYHQPRMVVSRSLKDLEAQLVPEGFLRVHKSYLVNRRHVTRYLSREGRHAVVLSTDQRIPVSRLLKHNLMNVWEPL